MGLENMNKKNIKIKESVYEKLKAIKRRDESFSDVIERLIEKKAPSYDELVKLISKNTAKTIKEMKKERKNWSKK